MEKNINKTLYYYLALILLVSFGQSIITGLSSDEIYYWVYAQFPNFGYFDHPPMIGWFIYLSDIFFTGNLAIRFLMPFLLVFSLLLIWKSSEQKNLKYFILLSLSFPLIQGAGFLALPDSPLLLTTAIYFYLLKKYISSDSLKNSIFLGISIALMFFSKYHGAIVILLTLIAIPSYFKRKSFWLVCLTALAFFFPHLIWQYQNDFQTFKFHLFNRKEYHFEFSNLLNYISGQWFLGGITTFPFLIYSLIKIKTRDTYKRILLSNSLGFFIFLFLLAFRNKIEANWTTTAFVAILILFSSIDILKFKKILLPTAVISTLIGLAFRVVILFQYPTESALARVNELNGWDSAIKTIKSTCSNQLIVANLYQHASRLWFYSGNFVPAIHIRGRNSQFSLIDYKVGDGPICFVSNFRQKAWDQRAVIVPLGYQGPLYIIRDITIKELRNHAKNKKAKIFTVRP